ncbi:MAG: flagellar biosynthetic protein FliR [Pirellulaceae bacterium]
MQLEARVDPQTKAAMPILGNLIGMLVTAVLIGIGGHHMMIDAARSTALPRFLPDKCASRSAGSSC